MKLTRLVVRMLLLVSLLGATALIYAQDQHDDSKPKEEATKPAQEEAKPPKQEEAKPPKPEEAKPPMQNDAKPSREENQPMTRQNNRPNDQPSQAAGHEQMSQQPAQASGGQRGGHIPDDKFRANFGRQHTVVINRPTIVEGQPRFQYGGYWFNIVDPWPADWAYTDECYIDFVDGEYFLFDLLHPGVRVALFVVL
jgi:hypothetical protein